MCGLRAGRACSFAALAIQQQADEAADTLTPAPSLSHTSDQPPPARPRSTHVHTQAQYAQTAPRHDLSARARVRTSGASTPRRHRPPPRPGESDRAGRPSVPQTPPPGGACSPRAPGPTPIEPVSRARVVGKAALTSSTRDTSAAPLSVPAAPRSNAHTRPRCCSSSRRPRALPCSRSTARTSSRRSTTCTASLSRSTRRKR